MKIDTHRNLSKGRVSITDITTELHLVCSDESWVLVMETTAGLEFAIPHSDPGGISWNRYVLDFENGKIVEID